MLQLGRCFRFDQKPTQHNRGSEMRVQHHLERNCAVEAYLPCLVNDAHAAAANLLDQFVVPKLQTPRRALALRRRRDGIHEPQLQEAPRTMPKRRVLSYRYAATATCAHRIHIGGSARHNGFHPEKSRVVTVLLA